jgi:hypothetical protein
LAGTTGLEPAASAVTGQRSNQLNYVPLDLGRVGNLDGIRLDESGHLSMPAVDCNRGVRNASGERVLGRHQIFYFAQPPIQV